MSKLEILYGTEQKYSSPESHTKQRVEVPVRYVEDVKISYGRTRMITCEVTVLGTIEVTGYGISRVEYGHCVLNGYHVIVVKDGTSWRAVERYDEKGNIA